MRTRLIALIIAGAAAAAACTPTDGGASPDTSPVVPPAASPSVEAPGGSPSLDGSPSMESPEFPSPSAS